MFFFLKTSIVYSDKKKIQFSKFQMRQVPARTIHCSTLFDWKKGLFLFWIGPYNGAFKNYLYNIWDVLYHFPNILYLVEMQ